MPSPSKAALPLFKDTDTVSATLAVSGWNTANKPDATHMREAADALARNGFTIVHKMRSALCININALRFEQELGIPRPDPNIGCALRPSPRDPQLATLIDHVEVYSPIVSLSKRSGTTGPQ